MGLSPGHKITKGRRNKEGGGKSQSDLQHGSPLALRGLRLGQYGRTNWAEIVQAELRTQPGPKTLGSRKEAKVSLSISVSVSCACVSSFFLSF